MIRIALSLVLAAALTHVLSARTFTNSKGKQLEAEIVRATDTTVTLILKNQRTATIKTSTLSKEDQEYVKQWLADMIPRLRIKPTANRSLDKDVTYNGPHPGIRIEPGSRPEDFVTTRNTARTQGIDLSVEVRNEDTAKGLEASTMKFYLVGRNQADKKNYHVLLVQSQPFSVAAAGKTNVKFRNVMVHSRNKSGFRISGYAIVATRDKDQRRVYSHASTATIKRCFEEVLTLNTGDMADKNFKKIEVVKPAVPVQRPDPRRRIKRDTNVPSHTPPLDTLDTLPIHVPVTIR